MASQLNAVEVRERWHRTRWVPPRRVARLEDLARAWEAAVARAVEDGKEAGQRAANLSALRSLLESFATLEKFRGDVPTLCAEVERLQKELADAHKEVEATDRALQRALNLSSTP